MCGIAGYMTREHGREIDGRAMLSKLAHRGPDGEGTWETADGGVWLGHRRLAIIDPMGSHQPISNADGTVQVTFNGCIYNFRELRRELLQLGHSFQTYGDSEVIVHAWVEWGASCIEHFNGMWAFALWDERKQRLFCSRDRVGIKPFYYYWDGETFLFASEIKALLASGLVKAERDDLGLMQYLTFQFCLNGKTMFKQIHRLEPGYCLELGWEDPAPQTSQFWDISYLLNEERDEEYFIDQIRWVLEDSVRLRLRSDVPLGAHLSGGMDSTAVVCLAKLLLEGSPLATFTGKFGEDERYDETKYARLVSERVGTQYRETDLNARHFIDSFERIVWHMDEPAAGPGIFPQFWVSKLAADHVKVVLGGQGGDEIFIGYARYLVAYLEECLKGSIECDAGYADTLGSLAPNLGTLRQYVPMMRGFWAEGLFEAPDRRYFRLMNRLNSLQDLLTPEFAAEGRHREVFDEFSATFNRPGQTTKINRIGYFDLKTHLQALLQVEDRTSMAWGLESRVPLLDHRILELVASIPAIIKFKNGELKHLLRRAIKNLIPHEVLDRKDKMGFPVPLTDWIKGPLREFVSDILLSQSSRERDIYEPKAIQQLVDGESTFGRATWGALNIEMWHRTFLDGRAETPPIVIATARDVSTACVE